jgi:hypothetical protein
MATGAGPTPLGPHYGARRNLFDGVRFSWGVDSEREQMNFAHSNDHSLLSFYESVRRQVEADKSLSGRVRFVGDTAKQYAERLREEMERRRLRFIPIDWPR